MSVELLAWAAEWLLTLAAGVAGLLALVILLRAFVSRRLAELRSWHSDRVLEELRAADYAADPGLEELFERERALVRLVQERAAEDDPPPLSRYLPGGRRAPAGRNLSFLLTAEEPRAAALVLHGLTDSPYLMRGAAEAFHRRGATVLGLRLPGHGTAPGGLLSVRWQDWLAAAEYGARQLERLAPGRPLWLSGFSTGATLCLHLALTAALDGGRRAPAGRVLMAPAVDLSWVARFALWHRTLSWLPYFTKFRWQDVKPECDPCKYSSFPKRAGAEIYRLTQANWSLARRLTADQRRALPPILAFQSLADATVAADGIARLLLKVGDADDELVLFDLNRSPELEGFLSEDAELGFPQPALRDGAPAPFAVTLVTNRETGTGAVEELRWAPGAAGFGTVAAGERRTVDESWPQDVFSLSHLALPVPAEDPLYGAGTELGDALPYGERGVLEQPLEDLMRLRYNPFFVYLSRRLAAFVAASGGPPAIR